jgi:hypothetical protein
VDLDFIASRFFDQEEGKNDIEDEEDVKTIGTEGAKSIEIDAPIV